MDTINGFVRGDLTVSDAVEILGTVKGVVTILASGKVLLKGTIDGDCIVTPGGAGVFYGTVLGSIVNRGNVEIWGVVNSLSNCGGVGKSLIKPKSVVKTYED